MRKRYLFIMKDGTLSDIYDTKKNVYLATATKDCFRSYRVVDAKEALSVCPRMGLSEKDRQMIEKLVDCLKIRHNGLGLYIYMGVVTIERNRVPVVSFAKQRGFLAGLAESYDPESKKKGMIDLSKAMGWTS